MRLHPDPERLPLVANQRLDRRPRGGILQLAEPLDRKAPGDRAAADQPDAQRRQRLGIPDPLQRKRQRPPVARRVAVSGEHGRAQRGHVAEADQRVDAQAHRFDRRRQRVALLVGVDAGQGPGAQVRQHHPRDGAGTGLGRLTDEAEGLGGAALHPRVGIGQRGGQRLDTGRVADQADRERRHRPHLGLAVAGQHCRQRLGAGRQAGPAHPERRPAAHCSFGIGQQRHQRGDRRRRRRRVLDHAQVLEPQDRGNLLLEGGPRRLERRRWRAGCAGAAGADQGGEGRRPPSAARDEAAHRPLVSASRPRRRARRGAAWRRRRAPARS